MAITGVNGFEPVLTCGKPNLISRGNEDNTSLGFEGKQCRQHSATGPSGSFLSREREKGRHPLHVGLPQLLHGLGSQAAIVWAGAPSPREGGEDMNGHILLVGNRLENTRQLKWVSIWLREECKQKCKPISLWFQERCNQLFKPETRY